MTEDLRYDSSRRFRTGLAAIVALLCQWLFWRYSMPGPQLDGPCDLRGAVFCCGVAVLALMVVPLLIATRVLKKSPQQLGLGAGDAAFGIKSVICCSPVMMLGTWLGRNDPQIQSFYPIPGDTVSDSVQSLSIWFAAYFVFYVSFEFFYRGYLLALIDDLQSARSVWKLIAIQALCCGAIHLGKPTMELIASLPASVLFGWIAWRSGSIWYALVIHFLVGVVNDLGAIG